MEQGNLFQIIHNTNDRFMDLPLPLRLQLALGAAQGLELALFLSFSFVFGWVWMGKCGCGYGCECGWTVGCLVYSLLKLIHNRDQLSSHITNTCRSQRYKEYKFVSG